MWIALAALLVPPASFEGYAIDGRVDLELRADGSARFGGAECRATTGGALVLTCGAQTYTLEVSGDADAPVLLGPPFGRVDLRRVERPAETPPAPPPPPDRSLAGAWRFEASGGALTLVLAGDGGYTMLQEATGGAPSTSTGRWQSDGESLTLVPEGGAALRYRVARGDDRLRIGGGDLPSDVELRKVAALPAPPL